MKEETNQTTSESEVQGTVFDDVFRTMAQKMPYLLIPLINEAFGTDYSADETYDQLRNEHYEKFGKVITDSIFRIRGNMYHIECQSTKDGTMSLRMLEYDFSIAVEHGTDDNNGIMEVNFPESCVLYIRNYRDMPERHQVRVRFPDKQTVIYSVPVIMAQDYTIDSIFEKKLLMLLPYYILRYEHFVRSKSENAKKIQKFLRDYEVINEKLSASPEFVEREQAYIDLIALINKIAEYIVPEDSPLEGKVGDIMGGTVLKLRSEELMEAGIEKGIDEGILTSLRNLMKNAQISVEKAMDMIGIQGDDRKKYSAML